MYGSAKQCGQDADIPAFSNHRVVMNLESKSRDLSEIHEPISTHFSTGNGSTQAHELTAEQISFFETHGYLAGVPVLDELQIELLREELSEFMRNADHAGANLWYEYHANESSDPNTQLFHALGAWRLRPGFHDLLWHLPIVGPASQLLAGAVRFWHDQLFCKPARHGGVVAWHQDYSYWTRTQPMAHLTCWIGLDPSTKENGCVHYVPGSHRWPLLPRTELAGDMNGLRQQLSQEQWEAFQSPVPVELAAGECVFHHPLMVHGSFENRTDSPRRAVVLNFVRDGVCSADDSPLLHGTQTIPTGQPLAGQFYPLLYVP